jgi:hypothetical protein
LKSLGRGGKPSQHEPNETKIEFGRFEQASIVCYIGRSTAGKKRESQCIYDQMPFNPICRFVEAKAFRVYTGITGVLCRL